MDPSSIKQELTSVSNDESQAPLANANPTATSEEMAVDEASAVNGESSSVCVSIEPNHESEIYEIQYDGTEIYKE